ncbi:MAG TPA: peptidylprolyl isomerase [Candidatus Hydrogenedentes bacterium]|nr:peptidylprolyl isomerase [Candidatus Hydrogenedentota bacterium]
MKWLYFLGLLGLAGMITMTGSGCGQIADPDNIKIAKVDDTYITRGDLFRLLNDMDDADRPKINNRADLLRVLNQHIDSKIKTPLGQQLAQEGKIRIPRDAAREQYFKECGDDQEQMRAIWGMEPPAGGEITPLMKVYNLTPQGIVAMKNIIEQKTDKILERLQGDQAVQYLAVHDLQTNKLTIDQAELEREYKLRKASLKKLEWMRFQAVQYPGGSEDALAQAAKIRERLNAGETFEGIVAEIQSLQATSIVRPGVTANVIESEIENNPDLQKFKGFWAVASGAEPGTIIGPVYLPQYQQMSQDAQGRTQVMNMPEAWLVLKVLDNRPESEMSLDEAKMTIMPSLVVAQEMKNLREQHGVEIYEDKLPDPRQLGGDLEDPFKDL